MRSVRIGIDTGGTFTDVLVREEDTRQVTIAKTGTDIIPLPQAAGN